jgi:hypothetical protein
MKKIKWGYIWKTSTESVDYAVEMFSPTLGRNWNLKMIKDDIAHAKANGAVAKNVKPKIYRVILEEVE